MEPTPDPWISALRRSHEALLASAGPLSDSQLDQRSYDSEWSIAQELSHLGSGAEIGLLGLDAAASGQEPPDRESFPAIWESWNSRGAAAQRADALTGDERLTQRFEALTPEQRRDLKAAMFGMEFDTAGLARLRLGEHALHTWDIAVALDPSATVPGYATELLIDALDQFIAWVGKPDGEKRRLRVVTSGPAREFILETGDAVTLTPAEDDGPADVRLPAEAFLRLVYGRLDPDHTPPIETGADHVAALRAVFTGF